MRKGVIFAVAAVVVAAAAAVIVAAARQPAAGAGTIALADAAAAGAGPTVTVYKSPTCGCCRNWVDHMREHGFEVVVHDTTALDGIKDEHGVATALRSCHTALVDGYVLEGHVPADVVRRLLEERPEVAGLAVPGMPMGSPGMEGPYKESYDVIAFDREGGTRVYARR